MHEQSSAFPRSESAGSHTSGAVSDAYENTMRLYKVATQGNQNNVDLLRTQGSYNVNLSPFWIDTDILLCASGRTGRTRFSRINIGMSGTLSVMRESDTASPGVMSREIRLTVGPAEPAPFPQGLNQSASSQCHVSVVRWKAIRFFTRQDRNARERRRAAQQQKNLSNTAGYVGGKIE